MSEVSLQNVFSLGVWLVGSSCEDDDIGRQKKYALKGWVRIALTLLITRIDQRIVCQSYGVKHERKLTPPTLMTG